MNNINSRDFDLIWSAWNASVKLDLLEMHSSIPLDDQFYPKGQTGETTVAALRAEYTARSCRLIPNQYESSHSRPRIWIRRPKPIFWSTILLYKYMWISASALIGGCAVCWSLSAQWVVQREAGVEPGSLENTAELAFSWLRRVGRLKLGIKIINSLIKTH